MAKKITFNASDEACKARTDAILTRARALPNETAEWHALFAVLAASHGWSLDDSIAYSNLIDTIRIAERLDEIRNGWLFQASEAVKQASTA